MKYVYILETGQLDKTENKFFFFNLDVFSSKKSAVNEVLQSIRINQATGVVIEDIDYALKLNEVEKTLYTYDCMSSPCVGEEAKPMRVRYVLRKMLVTK
jgi:hypothetical protein